MIFNMIMIGYAICDKARQNAITRAMKKFWEEVRKSQEKNIFFFGNGDPCASM